MTFSSHWDKNYPKCGVFLFFPEHAFTCSAWLVMGLLDSTSKLLQFLAAIRMSSNKITHGKKKTQPWSHNIYYGLSGPVQHSLPKYSMLYFIVGKFSFGL